MRFSASQVGVRSGAPLFGEHSDEILCELGYDPGAISSLREEGVI